jgi:hypothetical protein
MRAQLSNQGALAAVLVATYLVTNPAAKQGGYVETDLVVNKSPLTDKMAFPTPVRLIQIC